VLSDNGLCFTGRLHGTQVAFERSLGELGVQLINAGPYHPQTLGKLERFHRTLKEWLFDEGPAEDLPHLQELLDAFRHHYNTERPHQGIGDLTPSERFDGQPLPDRPRQPPPLETLSEPSYPERSILRSVSPRGTIGWRGHPGAGGSALDRRHRQGRPCRSADPRLLGRDSGPGARSGPEYLLHRHQEEKGATREDRCHIGCRYAVSRIFPEQTDNAG